MYITVPWNDCQDNMTPDISCCTYGCASFYSILSVHYNCNHYFYSIVFNSCQNCTVDDKFSILLICALYGFDERLINTNTLISPEAMPCHVQCPFYHVPDPGSCHICWLAVCIINLRCSGRNTCIRVYVKIRFLLWFSKNGWNYLLQSTKTH